MHCIWEIVNTITQNEFPLHGVNLRDRVQSSDIWRELKVDSNHAGENTVYIPSVLGTAWNLPRGAEKCSWGCIVSLNLLPPRAVSRKAAENGWMDGNVM